MEDLIALAFLEAIYDRIEDRYGVAAAWLTTAALAVAVISILVWVLVRVLG
ncbi:hypothetical protein [Sphingomonas sp.]|uniref:hypothetical protein n=1 Tax=Sphingomonas sp. TaxID=28214 RepID=UPI0025EF027F|nr:hypothetical protein [Sphingomonas sp.]